MCYTMQSVKMEERRNKALQITEGYGYQYGNIILQYKK